MACPVVVVEGGITWSRYHKEVRDKTEAVEMKLQSLQRAGDGGSEGCAALQEEIGALLQGVKDLNDGVDSQTLSHAERMQLNRYRDLYNDSVVDLERISANVTRQRERSELLGNVHASISSYSKDAELLEKERDHISKSIGLVERLQQEASHGHDILIHSQGLLERSSNRIREITANNLPAVHNILNLISRKRHRDNYILGGVITLCVFLCWVFW